VPAQEAAERALARRLVLIPCRRPVARTVGRHLEYEEEAARPDVPASAEATHEIREVGVAQLARHVLEEPARVDPELPCAVVVRSHAQHEIAIVTAASALLGAQQLEQRGT
jgi:hypothetical protein